MADDLKRRSAVLLEYLPKHIERLLATKGYLRWIDQGNAVGRLQNPVGESALD